GVSLNVWGGRNHGPRGARVTCGLASLSGGPTFWTRSFHPERMANRPARSLKHEYELFVEEEIENYKESIPRHALLSIGDEGAGCRTRRCDRHVRGDAGLECAAARACDQALTGCHRRRWDSSRGDARRSPRRTNGSRTRKPLSRLERLARTGWQQ